jgi:hypothetical protein
MSEKDDIPSLTLGVLQNIQHELVGLRGETRGVRDEVRDLRGDVDALKVEVQGLRTDVGGLEAEVKGLRTDVDGLKGRFDNFLTFVGRDVQDLEQRVSALEEKARRS